MNYSHNVKSMISLARVTEQFLTSLPAEFSKKEFETARKLFAGHPLSLQTCRDYYFVVVVRTEPTTYTKEEDVWVDTKGRKYTFDEMKCMNSSLIAKLFDRPGYSDKRDSIYGLPYHEESVEHPCIRNIFTFNAEKFKRFLEENA